MNGQFFLYMYRYVALLLFLVGCGGGRHAETANTPVVKVVTATAVEYQRDDFPALTTADDAVNLAFKISGRVVDVPVAKGVAVKRGEIVARLDSRDVELQVEATKSALREAQSRLDRARRLFAHSAISEQEVESLENALAQAQSAYDNALDMLSETRILAPFDGVVERTYVDTFERVSSGQAILRIVNPVSTTVGFTAPESLVNLLGIPTTRYSVEFDAWPGVAFSAVIKSFARTSSDALGFPVSLRLVDVDNTRYAISPGMTCIATVITPERDQEAVRLPLTAIYAPVGDKNYVWVVGADDRVSRREVVLGSPVGSDSVVVLRGVAAGERVVVAGVYHLNEGERVRVI